MFLCVRNFSLLTGLHCICRTLKQRSNNVSSQKPLIHFCVLKDWCYVCILSLTRLFGLFNCFNSIEFRSPFEFDLFSKSFPECLTCLSNPFDVDGCWSARPFTSMSSSSGSTVTDVDSDLGDGPSFIVLRSYTHTHGFSWVFSGGLNLK